MRADERLDVIDLIINVLMEHEKKLDDIVCRLGSIVETLAEHPDFKPLTTLRASLPVSEEDIIPTIDEGFAEDIDEEEFEFIEPLLGSILIVDDDKLLVEAFQYILEDVGFTVDTVHTANLALMKVRDKGYQLAIVDLRLPDMIGSDLAKMLKEQQEGLSVVLLSGSSKGIEGEEFLSKPVTHEKLLEIIANSLKGSD